jgi:hypothetical protein
MGLGEAMTDMAAIEELRAAATKLRTLATDISGAPWVRDDKDGTVRGADGTIIYDYSCAEHDGDRSLASGRAQAAYTLTMQPAVALAMADWFDDEAVGAQTETGQPTAHALVVARAILAGAS